MNAFWNNFIKYSYSRRHCNLAFTFMEMWSIHICISILRLCIHPIPGGLRPFAYIWSITVNLGTDTCCMRAGSNVQMQQNLCSHNKCLSQISEYSAIKKDWARCKFLIKYKPMLNLHVVFIFITYSSNLIPNNG